MGGVKPGRTPRAAANRVRVYLQMSEPQARALQAAMDFARERGCFDEGSVSYHDAYMASEVLDHAVLYPVREQIFTGKRVDDRD